jgi:3-oxoacyl-[acyl-carrier protein] reductase
MAVPVDMADRASAGAMAEAVLNAHGRIDVLINNAAVSFALAMKPFEEIDGAEFDRVMAGNARGTFNRCQAVAPAVRRQDEGEIVDIAASLALTGRPFHAHYVASKGAVAALTRALAAELGGAGIDVDAISPRGIETEAPRGTIREDRRDAIIAVQSLDRRGSVADMTGATPFLDSAMSD